MQVGNQTPRNSQSNFSTGTPTQAYAQRQGTRVENTTGTEQTKPRAKTEDKAPVLFAKKLGETRIAIRDLGDQQKLTWLQFFKQLIGLQYLTTEEKSKNIEQLAKFIKNHGALIQALPEKHKKAINQALQQGTLLNPNQARVMSEDLLYYTIEALSTLFTSELSQKLINIEPAAFKDIKKKLESAAQNNKDTEAFKQLGRMQLGRMLLGLKIVLERHNFPSLVTSHTSPYCFQFNFPGKGLEMVLVKDPSSLTTLFKNLDQVNRLNKDYYNKAVKEKEGQEKINQLRADFDQSLKKKVLSTETYSTELNNLKRKGISPDGLKSLRSKLNEFPKLIASCEDPKTFRFNFIYAEYQSITVNSKEGLNQLEELLYRCVKRSEIYNRVREQTQALIERETPRGHARIPEFGVATPAKKASLLSTTPNDGGKSRATRGRFQKKIPENEEKKFSTPAKKASLLSQKTTTPNDKGLTTESPKARRLLFQDDTPKTIDDILQRTGLTREALQKIVKHDDHNGDTPTPASLAPPPPPSAPPPPPSAPPPPPPSAPTAPPSAPTAPPSAPTARAKAATGHLAAIEAGFSLKKTNSPKVVKGKKVTMIKEMQMNLQSRRNSLVPVSPEQNSNDESEGDWSDSDSD